MTYSGDGKGPRAGGGQNFPSSMANADADVTAPLTKAEVEEVRELRRQVAQRRVMRQRAASMPGDYTYGVVIVGDVVHGADRHLWGVASVERGSGDRATVTLTRLEQHGSGKLLPRHVTGHPEPTVPVEVWACAGTKSAVEWWHRTTGRAELMDLRAELASLRATA